MNQPATIVRTGRKFSQVLEGARHIFMRDGFEGSSVDDIAREAGVSKATLYSYFPDKRLLFMEVAQAECARMAESALDVIDQTEPIRQMLTAAATQIVSFILSDFSQRIFRICVAESDRFPELGRSFYASGPEMGQHRISEFLQQSIDRGELKIDNVPIAAEQFAELCKVKLWTRAVFGIQTEFSQAERDEIVAQAVDMFMARYAV